jgi:hypothetical protein
MKESDNNESRMEIYLLFRPGTQDAESEVWLERFDGIADAKCGRLKRLERPMIKTRALTRFRIWLSVFLYANCG